MRAAVRPARPAPTTPTCRRRPPAGAWVDAVRYRLHFTVTAAATQSTVVRPDADVQVQVSSEGGEGA